MLLLQFLKIFHLLRFQEFVVAFLTPAMILSNVLFPAPFFPIRAIRSFSLIWKEMSLNRVVPPNSTVNPSTVIILFSSCSNFCFFKQLPRMPRSCRFGVFIDDQRLPSFMTRAGLKRRPEQGTKGCSFDCRCKDTTFSGRMQAFTLTFYVRKAISSCNTISSIDFLSELYCRNNHQWESKDEKQACH